MHEIPTYRGRPGGYGEVLQVAWPLIVSTGSFTVMQFVDRVFLARYSAISIQAALPGGILSFTLICGFMALAGYANTFVAQFHGAGDKIGCSRATAQGIWMALLTWPLLLLLIPVGRAILRWSGHAPEVLAEELTYFTILLAGGLQVSLGAAVSSFFTGRGDTFTNMLAVVIGNLVNIVLDYIMIFGKFGCPAMGIQGAAFATVIGGFVSPAILLALYVGPRWRKEYGTLAHWKLDPELFGRLIRFGLPSGLHLLLDVASFTVFVLLVGRMGEVALAVSNIALSVNMVAFMPLVGISIAATTLVGQYQGRGDPATAERAGWNALRVGVFYMLAVATTYMALPEFYFRLFTEQKEGALQLDRLLPVGRYLLMMMAAWGVLDAANLILSGALKGAGDTRFVMWYSTLLAWGLWVPGEWLLVNVLHAHVLAAWGWMTIFIMILSSGFFWRFRSGIWKSINLLDRPPAPPSVHRVGEETSTLGEV